MKNRWILPDGRLSVTFEIDKWRMTFGHDINYDTDTHYFEVKSSSEFEKKRFLLSPLKIELRERPEWLEEMKLAILEGYPKARGIVLSVDGKEFKLR